MRALSLIRLQDRHVHMETHTSSRGRALTGIGLMCLGIFFLCVMDATVKWLNQSLNPMMVVWGRYFFAFVVTITLINPRTHPGVMRSRNISLQILRSLFLFMSTIAVFVALRFLQLVENMAIMFSAPLLVALLAGPVLGERVGMRHLTVIATGLLGVLIIIRPGLGIMHPAALLTLLGALSYACYGITTRLVATYDSAATTTFYGSISGAVLTSLALPLFWDASAGLYTWALMVVTGVLATIGHWLLAHAHVRAPASDLWPFNYSQIIWMLAFGYILFGDWPDMWTWVGVAITASAGSFVVYSEQQKARGSALKKGARPRSLA